MTSTTDAPALPRGPGLGPGGQPAEAPAAAGPVIAGTHFARLIHQAVHSAAQESRRPSHRPAAAKAAAGRASHPPEAGSDPDAAASKPEEKREAGSAQTVSFLAELAVSANWLPAGPTPPPVLPEGGTAAGPGGASQAVAVTPETGSGFSALPGAGLPANPTEAAGTPASQGTPPAEPSASPQATRTSPGPEDAGFNRRGEGQSPASTAAGAAAPEAAAAPNPGVEQKGEQAASPLPAAVVLSDDPGPARPGAGALGLSPAQPAVDTKDGMSAALNPGAMQATHEMNETAGSAEQNLPQPKAAAELSRLSERSRKASLASAAASGMSAAEAVQSLGSQTPGPGAELVGAELKTPAAQAAESVSRTLENASVTLKRMDAASVSMVLKPDAHTQLALHVKWHQGHLEAVAVLERGDLQALNTEWSQLQQRLGEQGVRLAALVPGTHQTASFGAGDFGSPQQQQQPHQPAVDLGGVEPPGMSQNQKNQARPSGVQTQSAPNGREWWA